MQSPYDPELRAEIRQRMSPPNRESVAEIARSTGVNAQTLYSWRYRWKQEGQLVPASSKAPELWSAADKLAAVIQAAALSGTDLGSFCRQRGLYPKQLVRRQGKLVRRFASLSVTFNWCRDRIGHFLCLRPLSG
jgi:transposase